MSGSVLSVNLFLYSIHRNGHQHQQKGWFFFTKMKIRSFHCSCTALAKVRLHAVAETAKAYAVG